MRPARKSTPDRRMPFHQSQLTSPGFTHSQSVSAAGAASSHTSSFSIRSASSPGHDGKAPRESARPLRPGNIGFFGEHLQAAVAIGAVLLRHAREKRFETAPSVAPDEHAGVVPYIGLSQQELLAPGIPTSTGR